MQLLTSSAGSADSLYHLRCISALSMCQICTCSQECAVAWNPHTPRLTQLRTGHPHEGQGLLVQCA